jgi:hypothetical protein
MLYFPFLMAIFPLPYLITSLLFTGFTVSSVAHLGNVASCNVRPGSYEIKGVDGPVWQALCQTTLPAAKVSNYTLLWPVNHKQIWDWTNRGTQIQCRNLTSTFLNHHLHRLQTDWSYKIQLIKTIKIHTKLSLPLSPPSLCVSHKIVETYRNQHAPSSQKGKMEWCANGSNDQSHLGMRHILKTGQNIGQAPWAFDRMDMCTIKVVNQSKLP